MWSVLRKVRPAIYEPSRVIDKMSHRIWPIADSRKELRISCHVRASDWPPEVEPLSVKIAVKWDMSYKAYSADAIPCRMAYAVRAASVWSPSFSAIFCL